MRIVWRVTRQEIQTVRDLVRAQRRNRMVRRRKALNLRNRPSRVTRGRVWHVMVGCLLTTQQRSSPGAPVDRFLRRKPFPLSYSTCLGQSRLEEYVRRALSRSGGIRRTRTVGREIRDNLAFLEGGGWRQLRVAMHPVIRRSSVLTERRACHFIADHLAGFGPKQSRNMLQWLGLTRYEIPIDSRITKWLNANGFPIRLNASALSDRAYYDWVLDGVQALCRAARVYPCVFDSAVFSSFDER